MIFTGENILEFSNRFTDDMSCLAYLSDFKWAGSYVCTKCGHRKFTVRKKNLARDYNRKHHIESPTAGTIFHVLISRMISAKPLTYQMIKISN